MTTERGQIQDQASPSRPKLRVGVLGLGPGADEILPTMESMPNIDLVAAADQDPTARSVFQERYQARVHDTVEKLCKDPDVDVVFVATPNAYHCEHSIIAAEHGKHVMVEKPMALTLDEAERMIEAVEKQGVKLICGHMESCSPAIREMLRIIRSGRLGKLQAIQILAYTDASIRRSRGGDQSGSMPVPFGQAQHHAEIVRYLGGGIVTSVRAFVRRWLPEQPVPGYYTALLQLDDGTPATITSNGYGYFHGNELVMWGTANSRFTPEERIILRNALLGRGEESAAKVVRRDGELQTWLPNDPGLVIVSCEGGDMRHSSQGIYVYDDNGCEDVAIGYAPQRRHCERELDELYDAVALNRPIFHSGAWGMATLEVCLAIVQSAEQNREIILSHQIPIPPDHD